MNVVLLACLLLAAPEAAPAPAAPAAPVAPTPGACTSPVALAEWATDVSIPMGAWAEYASLVDGKPDLAAVMRVFVLDLGTPDKPQRWFEVDRKDGKVAFRIPLDGQGGGSPIFKQGRLFFALPSGEVEAANACRGTGKEVLRKVSLSTPAGRFQARYLKRTYGPLSFEYWVAENVPPLGLVQLKSEPDGTGMVLVARGTGAVSAFPERFTLAKFPSADSIRALLPLDPPRPDAGAQPAGGQDAGAASPPAGAK